MLRLIACLALTLYLVYYSSETSPPTLPSNASVVVGCVGDNITFPNSKAKCTHPKSRLIPPSRKTVSQSKGNIVKKGLRWTAYGIDEKDGGKYTTQLLCYNHIASLPIDFRVICKRLSADSGSQKTLFFHEPKELKNAEGLKLDIITVHLDNGMAFELHRDGDVTDKAKAHFGERIAVDLKAKTLILKDVRDGDSGNYTAIWSGKLKENKITRRFTLVLIIQKASSKLAPTLTPAHGQNTSIDSTVGVLPTAKQAGSGGMKLIVNMFPLVVCILVVWILVN